MLQRLIQSRRCVASVLAVALGANSIAFASNPTTAPMADANDPPVPAFLIPTYLSIGKDVRLKMQLIRRTLDDLTLDASTRDQANLLVEGGIHEIDDLVAEMHAGRTPSQKRVMGVPTDLKRARAKLLKVIGPDQSDLLQEKLQSLRGEARRAVAQVRANLADLQISAGEKDKSQAILKEADAQVDQLADHETQGDEYNAGRKAMNALLANMHDSLSQVLSSTEQSQLGDSFVQLGVNLPTTRAAQPST